MLSGGDQQLLKPPTASQASFSSTFFTTAHVVSGQPPAPVVGQNQRNDKLVPWDHDAVNAAGIRAQDLVESLPRVEQSLPKVEQSTTLPAAVKAQAVQSV